MSELTGLVAWLGKTVRDARVASAKAVLREYEKWAENPWTYVPPPGVDYLRPPQETNLASLFDNPQPPNLLRLAQAGISPSLVAGTASAPLETIVCATVTAGALASASAIAVGMAIMAETILPYTLQAAGTTLGAATVAGPAIIITATVILSIHSVHVVQREMLPNRLAEIVAAAEAEAVPSADVLVAQPDGLKTIMGALLTRMY